AHVPVRLHQPRGEARVRGRAVLHRRAGERVPGVRGPGPQGLRLRRRRLQGLGLLPDRQPQERVGVGDRLLRRLVVDGQGELGPGEARRRCGAVLLRRQRGEGRQL
ncbi:MAG: putative regulatory protein, FmdB family, partial [uncultured Blastococcus sp.]